MEVLSVLLPALGIGVIILMLVEVRQWRTGRHPISRGQLALRMVGGVVLLALLSGIFVGLYILGLRTPHGRAVLFLAWWMGCLALAVGLLFLALADMRHLEQRRREREHELWHDFAWLLAERIRGERGEDKPDAPDERD